MHPRPRHPSSRRHNGGILPISSNSRGSRSSSHRVSSHSDVLNQNREYDVPSSSSSRRAHGRASQRHRRTDVTSSRTTRTQHRPQQYALKDVEVGQRQLDILDYILNESKDRKRRSKRSSSQTQHGELLIFVRVFVSVILLTAIICVAVGFIFWMLYKISFYASSLSLGSWTSNNDGVELGPDFVRNEDKIKQMLERAAKQVDKTSKVSDILHSTGIEESQGLFERIPHPGNPNVHVSVPKFYVSVPVKHGDLPPTTSTFREYTAGKLLTPDVVSLIGSSSSGGERDPVQRTIFVSLLSNNDSNCPRTVANILATAYNPSRVRIAIVDKTDPGSSGYIPCDDAPQPCDLDPDQIICNYKANVDIYELNPDMDAGTLFRRHIMNRMYRGEYYALQVGYNSAVAFSSGWDAELIQQFEATSNEMAVITTYLSDSTINDREMANVLEARPERFTICHASFEGVTPNRRLTHLRQNQLEQVQPPQRKPPQLQPYWSSEMSFARGHFILNVPYESHICGLDEQDEEISMTLRAFTHGYDFYTPTKSVLFRYADEGKRFNDKPKECNASAIVKSRHRLNDQLSISDNGESHSNPFGLGAVRTPQQFYKCYGIHMNEHITEHRMCEFVTSGNLHDEFTAHLRSNGMGIDYSGIDFRFHELISIHKDSERMS